jgi:hypothetical protein
VTEVALAVGSALTRHRIRAVLTGGACASLHSKGDYVSLDIDLILTGSTTQSAVDRAMADVGFRRRGDRYIHPRSRFYVEFPRGPLAIGSDFQIRPVERRAPVGRILLLSPTDSCRDRLAAFYHWNDRQSLKAAVSIALRNRVKLGAIRRWSIAEGAAARFAEFEAELVRARARVAARGRATLPR